MNNYELIRQKRNEMFPPVYVNAIRELRQYTMLEDFANIIDSQQEQAFQECMNIAFNQGEVTLSDILLMINKNIKLGDMYFIRGSGEIMGYEGTGDIFDICLINLTLPIKDQSEETLKALWEIISK